MRGRVREIMLGGWILEAKEIRKHVTDTDDCNARSESESSPSPSLLILSSLPFSPFPTHSCITLSSSSNVQVANAITSSAMDQ